MLKHKQQFMKQSQFYKIQDSRIKAMAEANAHSDQGQNPQGSRPGHTGSEAMNINTNARSKFTNDSHTYPVSLIIIIIICWPTSVGSASVQVANRKALKYAALPTTHVFQPVAIETLGPLGPSACDFINQIGSRMSALTGDRRETAFLFQRLSMAIQRFNLVAFLGTFPSAIEDEA